MNQLKGFACWEGRRLFERPLRRPSEIASGGAILICLMMQATGDLAAVDKLNLKAPPGIVGLVPITNSDGCVRDGSVAHVSVFTLLCRALVEINFFRFSCQQEMLP